MAWDDTDQRLYEHLRKQGESEETAVRLARARAGEDEGAGRDTAEAESYEGRTRAELEQRAAELGVEGHSGMSGDELIDALRER